MLLTSGDEKCESRSGILRLVGSLISSPGLRLLPLLPMLVTRTEAHRAGTTARSVGFHLLQPRDLGCDLYLKHLGN